MNYGKAIRICRAAYGLNQAQLAERLEIGPSQLSLIESGRRQPSVQTLKNIASELKISLPLLTLLASEPKDLEKEQEEDLKILGKSLLRLLVTAEEEGQLTLDLK